MRSISNNLLASEQPIVKKMTDDSLQELNRLQAVAAALQERPDDEVDTTELEDFDEDYTEEEELLAQIEDDAFDEEEEAGVLNDEYDELEDEQELFDDGQYELEEELVAETAEPVSEEDELDSYFDEDGFEDDELLTETEEQPVVTATPVETEQEEDFDMLDDGFDDDTSVEEIDTLDDAEEDIIDNFEDGFEDDVDLVDEETTPIIKQPVMSTPLVPPGLTQPVMSTPLVPPGLKQSTGQTPIIEENTDDDELSLLDQIDVEDEFDEQLDENDYAGADTDLDAQILEEMENDDLYDFDDEDGVPKSDDSFENFEPEAETTSKIEISDSAQIDDDFGDTDIDLSILDSVPLVSSTPADSKTTSLEEENARLRQQLAQLENEKLKQQIAAQQKALVTMTKAGGAVVQNSNASKDNARQQDLTELTEKERKQRKRWEKYAAMSTRELWKYVYRFMNMAGVSKAPVKAKILIDEFGSHNIKRLEATYIMATKDGYTC